MMQIYNSQMVQQANQLQSEYDSAPLAAVPNNKGVYPSHAKLPPIDSTSSLIRLNHGALKEYLTFYGITPPVVYLQPTKEREAGAMRLFLAKHIGCYGLHGTGKNATEFGASE